MEYIVFTMDCISSKNVNHITKLLKDRMDKLNADPLRNKDFLSPFVVMKGDEIQGVMKVSPTFLKNIRYLREACYPVKLRIGIGFGKIDHQADIDFSNPWDLNGTAFHHAREAMEILSEHHLFNKKPMSHLISGDHHFDLIFNTQLLLYDALLDKWSDRTYEAVYLKEKYGSFRAIDETEGPSSSAYTKRANIGNWSVVEEFEKKTSEIFEQLMK